MRTISAPSPYDTKSGSLKLRLIVTPSDVNSVRLYEKCVCSSPSELEMKVTFKNSFASSRIWARFFASNFKSSLSWKYCYHYSGTVAIGGSNVILISPLLYIMSTLAVIFGRLGSSGTFCLYKLPYMLLYHFDKPVVVKLVVVKSVVVVVVVSSFFSSLVPWVSSVSVSLILNLKVWSFTRILIYSVLSVCASVKASALGPSTEMRRSSSAPSLVSMKGCLFALISKLASWSNVLNLNTYSYLS